MEPQGYWRCSSPPAAAKRHSASLGKKPPSQMQKAYDSHQFKHAIGKSSFSPASSVQVPYLLHLSAVFHCAAELAPLGMRVFQAASQPGSNEPDMPLSARPLPPLR